MIDLNEVTKEFVTNKKYPGFRGAIKGLISSEKIRKIAVNNMSFHIDKGQIVGYIGQNGAGKSTTIKMMTGIMTPTSGTCRVDGIDPSKKRKRNAKNIGVVFGQRTQLWWDLPLCESYSILRELYAIPKRKYIEQMAYLDDVLDLSSFIKNSVRTLSLGQRMRADLAASLLHNPKVLYLDEPTIGLDVLVKEKIRKAILEINHNYGTTVILTTHDIEDIDELCNRIIIIDDGNKIYDGSLENIKRIYNSKKSIVFDVPNNQNLLEVDFNNILQIDKEDLEFCINEDGVCFEYTSDRINMSQIITSVARYTDIKNFAVKEMNLTDIVKKVYTNGNKTGNV